MGAIGWIVLGAVVLLVLFLVLTYNKLVRLRNQIEAAWSQIDVQLKRRYDLIPNLVETVKGYAAHERETLESVTRARQQAMDARGVEDQAQAENMLTQTLRQLFAVAEAYPDLKANQNFLALQEELTGTEGRIAFSRQFYNEQRACIRQRARAVPLEPHRRNFQFRPQALLRGRGAIQGSRAGRLRPGWRGRNHTAPRRNDPAPRWGAYLISSTRLDRSR